jgi:hypothetical protein
MTDDMRRFLMDLCFGIAIASAMLTVALLAFGVIRR